MKKIIAALAATCLLAVGLVAGTSTADAKPAVGQRACTNGLQASSTHTLWVDFGTIRPVVHNVKRSGDEPVIFTARANYNDCGTFVRVVSFNLTADPNGWTGCWSGYVQNFKLNINKIGSWDPGQVTFTCTSGTGAYTTQQNNPYVTDYLYPSDPSNERCFASANQISQSGATDVNGTSPAKCLI